MRPSLVTSAGGASEIIWKTTPYAHTNAATTLDGAEQVATQSFRRPAMRPDQCVACQRRDIYHTTMEVDSGGMLLRDGLSGEVLIKGSHTVGTNCRNCSKGAR